MSEPDQSRELTLLFYRQVVALDAQRHGDYKLGMTPNHDFASHTNSIPLTGGEFAESCKEYPIVWRR
ncbi:MAG: SapC family protein [Methylococcaceae bacterium]|nr:SapC family protein [Methylococcaceae bacterium]